MRQKRIENSTYHVLGADKVVIELNSLFHGYSEKLLGIRREREPIRWQMDFGTWSMM